VLPYGPYILAKLVSVIFLDLFFFISFQTKYHHRQYKVQSTVIKALNVAFQASILQRAILLTM
jgi:hypothetical protein